MIKYTAKEKSLVISKINTSMDYIKLRISESPKDDVISKINTSTDCIKLGGVDF